MGRMHDHAILNWVDLWGEDGVRELRSAGALNQKRWWDDEDQQEASGIPGYLQPDPLDSWKWADAAASSLC